MNTVAVWLMVIVHAHGNVFSTGPEFSTEAKCKQAAIVVQKSVDDIRWGANIKTPLCVKVEK